MRNLFIAGLALSAAACAPSPEIGATGDARLDSTGMEAAAAERAELIVRSTCSGCHAVGLTGSSPLPSAPTFREIAARRDLFLLEEDFGRGLVTSHPDMPPYRYRASEIDDLMAYFRRLEREGRL
ncbi:c-type cytochrome [Brevundimonas sp.]|uniref:c-type cytochrome n=1 Tax=Brevundimonas sp. TaxID=1871086 RepID=UPI00391CA291